MSDVNCPYCGTEQEINHDDGYGYEDGGEFEKDCTGCDKTFNFRTSISFSYDVNCKNGDHDMEPFGDNALNSQKCSRCDFFKIYRKI